MKTIVNDILFWISDFSPKARAKNVQLRLRNFPEVDWNQSIILGLCQHHKSSKEIAEILVDVHHIDSLIKSGVGVAAVSAAVNQVMSNSAPKAENSNFFIN